MTSRTRTRTALLAAAGVLAALTACTSGSREGPAAARFTPADVPFKGSLEELVPVGYPEPSPAPYRIAYLEPSGSNEFIAAVGEAATSAVQQLGGEVVVYDAEFSPDLQVSQFQQVLAQQVDGIFLFAVDPNAVEPLVEQAVANGVPVVGVEANSTSTTEIGALTSQLWQRREEQAYLQVRGLAQYVEPGAGIARITSSIPSPVIQQYLQFQNRWAEEFGLQVLGGVDNDTDDVAGGETAMTGVLARHPDLRGLLPYNDPSGIGAAAAARQQGSDIPIIGANGGTDGLDGVRQGKLQGTVRVDAVGLGTFGVWGIYDALQGVDIPKTAKIGAPVYVDAQNVETTPTWRDELAAGRQG